MSHVFVAAVLLLPSAIGLRLSSVEREPVLCAGSGNPCDGNQCCAGYPFSNSLTFPCPNADEGFAGCQTTERYTYQEETVVQSEPVKCPRILRLVQRGAMLPWIRGQQLFDLPVPHRLSKLQYVPVDHKVH